jgi:hypothetical protein
MARLVPTTNEKGGVRAVCHCETLHSSARASHVTVLSEKKGEIENNGAGWVPCLSQSVPIVKKAKKHE